MRLGRARGFGAPLWWLDPPGTEVQRIVREARAAVRQSGGSHGVTSASYQAWLRKVFAESSRRLAAAHIFVEE